MRNLMHDSHFYYICYFRFDVTCHNLNVIICVHALVYANMSIFRTVFEGFLAVLDMLG